MKKWERLGIVIFLSFLPWFLSSFLSGASAAAPVDFPKKEVTIIVSFGPGGMRDIIARGVGNIMSKYLGVSVVVMNMPGAGGARGMINIYHAAADGYTMGISMATDVIDQILEKRDYDNTKFTFIGRIQSSPGFFFVKSDSPFRSVKDFQTFGKPIRHSTFSLTSNTTVVPMIMANREGWELVVIGGYQGAAAATVALVRGEVEFSGPGLSSAKPFVDARQIRPILTVDRKRSPDFPDIPTVGEMGHPDLEGFGTDVWLVAPPGIPDERVRILEDALMKTLKDPEFLKWAKGAGVDPGPMTGEDTKKMVLNLFGLFERYKGDIEKYIKK